MEKLKKSPVTFDKKEHKYDLNGKELSGVTPIVHWLFPETYANIPESIRMAAADYGTMVHAACELSDLLGITESDSVKAYQELKKANGLTTIANEYLVSDEALIASSIDVVCSEEGKDDDALVDIKTTSKVLQHHLAVQLSIYAWLYEWQTERTVGSLYCMWLPKERYGQPALIPVQRIGRDVCQLIVKEYFFNNDDNTKARQALTDAGLRFEVEKKAEEMPAQYADVIEEVISIENQLKAMKEREKALKEGLLELMRSEGVKKWQSDALTLTYIAPTKRTAVDSTKLKKEYPDVYAECLRESNVSDSIKITIN